MSLLNPSLMASESPLSNVLSSSFFFMEIHKPST
jgi:hypothetical protein